MAVKAAPPPSHVVCNCTVSTDSNRVPFNPSGELTCRHSVLKIEAVTEEDLTSKYDCLAMNFHGFITHAVTLRKKNPSKACF